MIEHKDLYSILAQDSYLWMFLIFLQITVCLHPCVFIGPPECSSFMNCSLRRQTDNNIIDCFEDRQTDLGTQVIALYNDSRLIPVLLIVLKDHR